MKLKPLGTSDFKISEIGFGCMSLDVRQPDACSHLLRTAADAGINYFDTADLYDHGRNEEIVGQALSPVRDSVVIATKVGNEWNESGTEWKWNPTKKYILEAVDNSLKRLETDYIDVCQLHGGTIDDPFDETLSAFDDLKSQGKIRSYGISSIRPNVIKRWAEHSNADVVMMQYSLLDRRPEEHCLDLLEEWKINVVSRGSLAKGLLIDKPAKAYLDHSKEEIAELQTINKKDDRALENAIQFVLRKEVISSAVLGIRTSEQLTQILDAYHSPVDEESLKTLRSNFPAYTYQNHRI